MSSVFVLGINRLISPQWKQPTGSILTIPLFTSAAIFRGHCVIHHNPIKPRNNRMTFHTSTLRMSSITRTMKEALVQPDLSVQIVDVPIPTPAAHQVLIKVVVSGTNPKDWKRPFILKQKLNSGDDIAGVVEAVGDGVYEYKKGDRVAAFHEMMTSHGSFAEYAVAWDYATFPVPGKLTFEEAATVPLAAITAVVGLYHNLRLPDPWRPTLEPTPLIVYGASGAVGAYVIKLAKASNIHPILAVAGKGRDFVEQLIDRTKGDAIIDYRNGDEAVVAGINEALRKSGAAEVNYAYDAVSEKGSYQNISKVLGKKGIITTVLPKPADFEYPSNVKHILTACAYTFQGGPKKDTDLARAGVRTGGSDLAFIFFRLIARGLEQGWFTPHPHEVIPGGLKGIETGLQRLKNGEASAVKFVYRIAEETPKL